MAAVRVAINGFGRIGRQVLKALLERHPGVADIVAVNDLADPERTPTFPLRHQLRALQWHSGSAGR